MGRRGKSSLQSGLLRQVGNHVAQGAVWTQMNRSNIRPHCLAVQRAPTFGGVPDSGTKGSVRGTRACKYRTPPTRTHTYGPRVRPQTAAMQGLASFGPNAAFDNPAGPIPTPTTVTATRTTRHVRSMSFALRRRGPQTPSSIVDPERRTLRVTHGPAIVPSGSADVPIIR